MKRFNIISAISFLSLFVPSAVFPGISNPDIYLPQTGLEACRDENMNEICCGGTGQDADIRAGKVIPAPRFNDYGDGTVRDNLTGLVWLKDANCIKTRYSAFDTDDTHGDGMVTWQHALDFVAGINAGLYPDCGAGHTDWRMPNIRELASLVDVRFMSPSLANGDGSGQWLTGDPFTGLPLDQIRQGYWSSTPVSDDTLDRVLTVEFSLGGSASFPHDTSHFLWPVRGEGSNTSTVELPATGMTTSFYSGDDGDLQKGVSLPRPRFDGDGNGNITDKLTELIWLKDANCIKTHYPEFDRDGTPGDGMVTWQHALDFVAGINAGLYPDCGAGHTDWRLPNLWELLSLVNFNYRLPALSNAYGHAHWSENNAFAHVDNRPYWTSTPGAWPVEASAWSINMASGDFSQDHVDYTSNVWPVRGGITGSSHDLTVTLRGNGRGTVISSPDGIDCGADCCSAYRRGRYVRLTATPEKGSVFQGWEGDAECSNGRFTMNSDKNCTARFRKIFPWPAIIPVITMDRGGGHP